MELEGDRQGEGERGYFMALKSETRPRGHIGKLSMLEAQGIPQLQIVRL